MKHVTFTKVLSLLLCVVMFVTMLPSTYAFAEDEEEVVAAEAETVVAEEPAEEPAAPAEEPAAEEPVAEEPAAEEEAAPAEEEVVVEPVVTEAPVKEPLGLLATPVVSLSGVNSGMRVSWNIVSGADKYRVFRKDGSSWTRLGDTTGFSYIDTKAVPGKSYTYTVRCISADGSTYTSDYNHSGVTATFWPHATPELVSAKGSTAGVTVTWKAVENAAGYRVYRKTGSGSWGRIADVTGTSYTDTKAASSTSYSYTVRCLNGKGAVSSLFDTVGVSISYNKYATPKLISAVPNAKTIVVTWQAVEGAPAYRVFRKNPGSSTWVGLGNTTGTSFTDKNIAAGGEFTYTVRVVSADGKTFLSAFDTVGVKCTFYTDAKVTSLALDNEDGVKVSWKTYGSIPEYVVMRKVEGGAWEVLTTVTSSPYIDDTAKSNTTYYYTIRYSNGSGGYMGDYDKVGKSITYYEPPTLLSTANTVDGVKITWKAVPGVSMYRLYRKTTGSWAKLADVAATSYEDKTANAGTEYTYTVRCLSADGSKLISWFDQTGIKGSHFATVPIPTVEACSTGVLIKWNKTTGVEGYRVYRKTGSGSFAVVPGATNLPKTQTEFIDTTAVNATTYTYTVQGLDAAGDPVGNLNPGKVFTFFETPALKSVERSADGLVFNWTAVEGATTYRVFRKANNGAWIRLVDVAATSYTDTTCASGTKYTYTVRVLDADGNTLDSWFDTAGLGQTYYAVPLLTGAVNEKTGVKVTWQSVVGATEYQVFRKYGNEAWEPIPALGSTQTVTEYLDTSSKTVGKYSYTVAVWDPVANEQASEFDPVGLSVNYYNAPVLKDIAVTNGGLTISWKKVEGIGAYRIYRKVGNSGWAPLVDVGNVDKYTDATATTNNTYSYTVCCLSDGGGELSTYNETGLTTTFYPAPSVTKIENIGSGVRVTWTKIDGVSVYRLYRREAGGSFSQVTQVGTNSAVDTSAVSGKTYYYTVRCLNDAGNAFVSGYDTTGTKFMVLATPVLGSAVATKGNVKISWNVVGGAKGYYVYRKTDAGEWKGIATISNGSTNGYNDKTATPGITYTYTVRAFNGSDRSWFDTAGVTVTAK